MVPILQIAVPAFDLHVVLQSAGVLGFLTYMGGFAALQMGRLDGNGVFYALTNVVGAVFVLISLVSAFNPLLLPTSVGGASMLIQISWITIGLVGIWRRFRRAHVPSSPASFLRGR
ncbi:MAG: hypothetical protein AAF340_08590 [Pseudomonadota bacterium]